MSEELDWSPEAVSERYQALIKNFRLLERVLALYSYEVHGILLDKGFNEHVDFECDDSTIRLVKNRYITEEQLSSVLLDYAKEHLGSDAIPANYQYKGDELITEYMKKDAQQVDPFLLDILSHSVSAHSNIPKQYAYTKIAGLNSIYI